MKPFKEVIILDNVKNTYNSLDVNNTTPVNLRTQGITVLWRGSIEKFKSDFEIPNDAPLSTKETNIPEGYYGSFVTNWNWTTLNFKFNYHIWYYDSSTNTNYKYVSGSNNTIDLTIPNVIVFNGTGKQNSPINYIGTDREDRLYNPNIFRVPVGINTFIVSNKTNDMTAAAPSGSDRDIYLIFRYGVGGDDIQICLLTKNSTNMSYNQQPLILPYASLTFTGFNKIKRLK